MGLPAVWILAFLFLWVAGAFVATRVHPRHRAKIVAAAVIVPVTALSITILLHGNFSRSAIVFPPEGRTNAQVRKCFDDVFSEESLARLIQAEGLSSKLAPSEVLARIAVTYPGGEWDTFHWHVGSGNTWRWKAQAYAQLADALSSQIETRLKSF